MYSSCCRTSFWNCTSSYITPHCVRLLLRVAKENMHPDNYKQHAVLCFLCEYIIYFVLSLSRNFCMLFSCCNNVPLLNCVILLRNKGGKLMSSRVMMSGCMTMAIRAR